LNGISLYVQRRIQASSFVVITLTRDSPSPIRATEAAVRQVIDAAGYAGRTLDRVSNVWTREYSKRIPRDVQERALMKLQQLNSAGDLKDLSIPSSNQLEALKGDRKGEYSIRINKQWRICFRWRNGHALDVEIVDYH
jgi:proteic killer suppression protein